MSIPKYSGEVPDLTTAQMIEVDRLMIEEYRIELIQMMENAGRNLAHLSRLRFLNGDPRGKRVIVAAGTGGNGGGALVCARRLANWGAEVDVAITKNDDELTPVPAHQLGTLRRMGLGILSAEEAVSVPVSSDVALVVDGIIGYSLAGAPRGAAADLIRWADAATAPVLALDAPSGLDTTSGTVYEPAVRAAATMTLALPKGGLRAEAAREHVGELYLADISVPPALYAEPSLALAVGKLFAQSDVIQLV
jgi:NAD(P)H-hydrate epimerase